MENTQPKYNLLARIELTHVVNGSKIYVIAHSIGGYTWSETQKCSHVMTISGVFQAKETPDQIGKLLDEVYGNQLILVKGEKNATKNRRNK